MKKIFSYKLLLILCLLSMKNFSVHGQTSIIINDQFHNLQQNCILPANGNFNFSVLTANYALTDSIDFFIDFGDGNYVNQRTTQNFYSATEAMTYFNPSSYSHTYSAQGIFIVTYIATMPDGNADTIISPLMVTTTCNNVTGRVYVDVNSDCIYNAGDLPLSLYQMRLDYNNQPVFYGYTDNQGLFSLNALPGPTYSLCAGSNTDPQLTWTCTSSQVITISPAPSGNQDFIIRDSSAMHLITSLDTSSGTCIPLYADMSAFGATFLYSSPNDTIDLYIDFGDTHDTVLQCPVSSGGGLFGSFGNSISHIYTTIGNFNVTYIATTSDGLSDTIIRMNTYIAIDTCVISTISSYEKGESKISIYPNPSSEFFEFKISEESEGRIILTDVLGKEISSRKLIGSSGVFDISDLSDGIYFVIFETSQGRIVQKIFVRN